MRKMVTKQKNKNKKNKTQDNSLRRSVDRWEKLWEDKKNESQ